MQAPPPHVIPRFTAWKSASVGLIYVLLLSVLKPEKISTLGPNFTNKVLEKVHLTFGEIET